MNRNVLSAALLVLVLGMVLAFGGCQKAQAPETNRAVVTATPSPDKVDTAGITAQLTRLEQDWADAVKNGDADTVKRLMADDIVIVNPDGSTSTKGPEVEAVQARTVTMDAWDIQEPKVTVLDANNAFVTGRGVIKSGKYKDPKTKNTIDISGEYRFLDVYARRNGKWEAVASQTTPIQKNQ